MLWFVLFPLRLVEPPPPPVLLHLMVYQMFHEISTVLHTLHVTFLHVRLSNLEYFIC